MTHEGTDVPNWIPEILHLSCLYGNQFIETQFLRLAKVTEVPVATVLPIALFLDTKALVRIKSASDPAPLAMGPKWPPEYEKVR